MLHITIIFNNLFWGEEKMKKVLWTTLVLSLITAAMVGVARAPPPTKVYVEPGNLSRCEAGEYLIFDIKIRDVVGLFAFEVRVEWDPLVIKPVWVAKGDFLSQGEVYPTSITCSIDLGSAVIAEIRLDGGTTSGSGTLVTVEVRTVGSGSTAIELTATELFDVDMNPIGHSTVDGAISVLSYFEVTSTQVEHRVYSISGDEDDFIDMNATGVQKLPWIKYPPCTMRVRMTWVVFRHGVGMWIGYDESGCIHRLAKLHVALNATELDPGEYHTEVRAYYSFDGVEYFCEAKVKTFTFKVIP